MDWNAGSVQRRRFHGESPGEAARVGPVGLDEVVLGDAPEKRLVRGEPAPDLASGARDREPSVVGPRIRGAFRQRRSGPWTRRGSQPRALPCEAGALSRGATSSTP